ncbi:DUF1800 family protein [Heliobacterium gestii]|uniref:DUF1800 family protein n=1 Tax=Heliomicrobium gestii TaxID=2699 RepID=A0A845LG06_HELGE|nr:DUF1800 domain-containing protein [Heliomicrobium gestii]MBM7868118.1 uncharacterized protein (DUF1800 family) [Heliomicrobium gestii]MZP44354.1 DUF1800 family protein [Heliomicrobium gestii]
MLRRAGFGGSLTYPTPINAAAPEAWLQTDPHPPSLTGVVNDDGGEPLKDEEAKKARRQREQENLKALRAAWLQRMTEGSFPLQEKLALFWHNHFATSSVKVTRSLYMARQYDLFYRHGLGKFGDLLKAVTRDTAMLLWLDGNRNTAKAPNENYAREVMELFTLGVGHYTEMDIKNAARAFTGWQVDKAGQSVFNKKIHDAGAKTLFAKSGPFDADGVIHLLLEHPQTARFITAKVLRHFYRENPEPALVEELAGLYRQSDYDMKALLGALFARKEFVQAAQERSLVKYPTQFLAETVRLTGIRLTADQISHWMNEMGQLLFTPPNVAGWPGGEVWLNSATLRSRFQFAQEAARLAKQGLLVQSLPPTAEAALAQWSQQLCLALSASSRAALLGYAQGAWSATKAQGLLALLLISPENQRL